MNNNLSSIDLLGIPVTTASKRDIVDFIVQNALKSKEKMYIVTPNPEIMMYALKHKSFMEVLGKAKVAIPDGTGVLMAGRILKKRIMGRITGVDMMLALCHEASKRGLTVGLLGGRGNVAERTALCLREKWPELLINYAGDEWDESKILKFKNSGRGPVVAPPPSASHPSKVLKSSKSLQEKHIDILFVAFGFPKQEIWMHENLEKIPVTVAMGVGGAFDYISGKVKRAPRVVRDLGFEWAFRLINEPWRIKRQAALPQFVLEVLKEKFSGSK